MPDSAETTAHRPPGRQPQDSERRPPRPRARERGRMRRRLRQQKRIREALLLDLGALVYELHRHSRREPELLQAKAAELTAVDQEVRALADALEADESMLTLVAAGIAGTCESCGSLLSTDARYCGACGAPAMPAIRGPAPAATGDPMLAQPPASRQALPEEKPTRESLPEQEPPHDEPPEPEAGREEGEAVEEAEPPAPWLARREDRRGE